MSPPLLGIEEHNVPLMASLASEDCVSPSVLKEHNYLGLSDCSSVDSSTASSAKINLNLKATELRLGLPGSQSPEHEDSGYSPLVPSKLDEKPLFPLGPSKDGICPLSGNKRGFSDTESKNTLLGDAKWMSGQPTLTGTLPSVKTVEASAKTSNERGKDTMNGCKNKSVQPAAKAQVVGWPPVRPFRKSALAMATLSKNNDEVGGKAGPIALLVKVSMDGAPYLRKVDLRLYSSYEELSSSLEKMFSCFTIGHCGPKGTPSMEMMSDAKPRDLLHGPEYVLTYEDKDGDWMLVGDVPWDMFIASCKRLKIMKGSDAIGLAPRAMEKTKNPN